MNKKFLLISQVFYPDEVSTANLFTGLCSAIPLRNVDVEVWAAQPSYTEKERQPSQKDYNNIKIKYLPTTNFRKTSLPGRMINTFTFLCSVSVKLLNSKDKTPVWTHTTPPVLGLVLSIICVIKKRKLIYILLDIFPEGLVKLRRFSPNNPFIRIWEFFFTRTLRRCFRIITIGRDMKKLIDNKIKIPGKTLYIPLWQDEKLIHPGEFHTNSFINANNLTGNFVVQYSGNIGLWNEIKTIGKVINRRLPGLFFLIAGGGLRMKELYDELGTGKKDNLILLPFQSNNNFNNVINAAHIHLVTLKNDLSGIAVPSKIYGILAAGKPVIAMVPSDSEIAEIVKEENCGLVIDPDDEDELIRSIYMLMNYSELRITMGRNSRQAFEKKYTIENISGKYLSLLAETYS